MTGMFSAPPKPRVEAVPPPPGPSNQELADAAMRERQKNRMSRGRSSTLLAGGDASSGAGVDKAAAVKLGG